MSESSGPFRPPRLPYPATRVIRAATAICWGQKAVWLEVYAFDRGDGCFAAAVTLGARLGIAADTVESYRQHLALLGLLERHGTKAAKWFAKLPAACVPTGDRPTDREVSDLARELDRTLRSRAPIVRLASDNQPQQFPDSRPTNAGGPTHISASIVGLPSAGIVGLPSGQRLEGRLGPPSSPSPEQEQVGQPPRSREQQEAGTTAPPRETGFTAVAQVLATFDRRAKAWLAGRPPVDGGAVRKVPDGSGNRSDDPPICPEHGSGMTWLAGEWGCDACEKLRLAGAST